MARNWGLHLAGTYEDRFVSGKSDKRPDFQRMMRSAENGGFQAVVLRKSDRRIPLETGENPMDGGDSSDNKMFVLQTFGPFITKHPHVPFAERVGVFMPVFGQGD